MAMRRFDYRDGGLGLLWLEKCGAATNKQQSIGGTILGIHRHPLDWEHSTLDTPRVSDWSHIASIGQFGIS